VIFDCYQFSCLLAFKQWKYYQYILFSPCFSQNVKAILNDLLNISFILHFSNVVVVVGSGDIVVVDDNMYNIFLF